MRSYLLSLMRDAFSKVCMIIIMAALAVLGITQNDAVEVLSGLSGYWVVAIRVGLVVFALLIAWALVWHWLYQRRLRTWADRDRLELSAIACLSVGEKVGCPLNTDPQLSRHRLLKDAVASGELIVENIAGATANVGTQVTIEQFSAYAERRGGKGPFVPFSRDWRKARDRRRRRN